MYGWGASLCGCMSGVGICVVAQMHWGKVACVCICVQTRTSHTNIRHFHQHACSVSAGATAYLHAAPVSVAPRPHDAVERKGDYYQSAGEIPLKS